MKEPTEQLNGFVSQGDSFLLQKNSSRKASNFSYKQQVNLNVIPQMGKSIKNEKSPKPIISMALANSKNSYVNFSNPKAQPEICRSSFPYYLDDDNLKQAQKPMVKQIRILNRVLLKKKQVNTFDEFKFNKIASEEPPINQFLNYELSKDINNGLCDVKVLAQEIKKIKKQKQEMLEDKVRFKPNEKIKIQRSFKNGIAKIGQFRGKENCS